MTRDAVAGLVCLALSLTLLVATRGLPEASILVPIGPGAYPRVVLGVMALLSLWVLADAWRRRDPRSGVAARTDTKAGAEPRNLALVAAAFATFGAYVLLLPVLGFRLATFAFVAALQALLEPPRSPRGWIVLVVVALGTALIAHGVFERGLSVLLPRGSWIHW